jgi:hypothetical protein
LLVVVAAASVLQVVVALAVWLNTLRIQCILEQKFNYVLEWGATP